MSGADEAVTSPDQRRPGKPRLDHIGAVVTAALLLLLLVADHPNDTEVAWVCASSAVLLTLAAVDVLLRHNRLRS
jgi:hypothetical protein